MGAVLGLAAALAYGVSDFVAGMAARRVHFLWVSFIGALVGLVGAGAALVPFHGSGPSAQAIGWGLLSGVGSAVGSLALFRGYGHGEMAVAGPLSAVGAAAIPAVVGVALGDRLPPLGTTGVVLALPAIWLMAHAPGPEGGGARAGMVDGLVSGAGFAVLFVGLNRAGSHAGIWPVAAGMAISSLLLGVSCLVVRPAWELTTNGVAVLVVAGLLSIAANVLYFLATQQSLLVVAAVLTSVYPGVTVALAAMFLHERPDRWQVAGLLLGALAITLIVVS